jgi:hypothetical protein
MDDHQLVFVIVPKNHDFDQGMEFSYDLKTKTWTRIKNDSNKYTVRACGKVTEIPNFGTTWSQVRREMEDYHSRQHSGDDPRTESIEYFKEIVPVMCRETTSYPFHKSFYTCNIHTGEWFGDKDFRFGVHASVMSEFVYDIVCEEFIAMKTRVAKLEAAIQHLANRESDLQELTNIAESACNEKKETSKNTT